MPKHTIAIKDLYTYFDSSFGFNSQNFSHLSNETQITISACLNCLSQDIHPIFVIQHAALNALANETSFDFFDFDSPDAKTSFDFESSNIDDQSDDSKINLVLSQDLPFISCKFFSYSKNTCQDYAYANVVDSPTCSNSSVDSHTCSYVISQRICPFYQKDQQIFTKHSFIDQNQEYFYFSYLTRYKDGSRVVHIFNQEEHLLNQLSYSLEDFNQIDTSVLKKDISQIVTEIHQNSFLKDIEQNSFQDAFENSENSENSKSYILSLIN